MKRKEIDLNILKKLYEKYHFSTKALADIFDVSIRTIQRRLNELGFDLLEGTTRDRFGRLNCSGRNDLKPQIREHNGRYKGGIRIYRKIAFEDYNLPKVCYHCGSTKNLQIHHIDKNRFNNRRSNLRVVCQRCHLKIEHPDNIQKAIEARRKKRKLFQEQS